MGKITVKTKEAAGQVCYETETIFEDASDYFANEEAGNVTEIKVSKKKEKLH